MLAAIEYINVVYIVCSAISSNGVTDFAVICIKGLLASQRGDLLSGSNATSEWISKNNKFGAYKSCSVCNKDNLPYDIKSA